MFHLICVTVYQMIFLDHYKKLYRLLEFLQLQICSRCNKLARTMRLHLIAMFHFEDGGIENTDNLYNVYKI